MLEFSGAGLLAIRAISEVNEAEQTKVINEGEDEKKTKKQTNKKKNKKTKNKTRAFHNFSAEVLAIRTKVHNETGARFVLSRCDFKSFGMSAERLLAESRFLFTSSFSCCSLHVPGAKQLIWGCKCGVSLSSVCFRLCFLLYFFGRGRRGEGNSIDSS